jgi:hypothetical protein
MIFPGLISAAGRSFTLLIRFRKLEATLCVIFNLILYGRELHFSDSMQAVDYDFPADDRGEILDLLTGKGWGNLGSSFHFPCNLMNIAGC